MENLPVEILGDILSRILAARDVVLASATCRKWRQAFHEHLSVLSFDWKDWPGFRDLSTRQVEILITRTIFQTTRLHSLHIRDYHDDAFSTSAVTSWLLHTKRSLKELHCDLLTDRGLDAVDIYGMKKLEKVTLVHNVIENVDPNYHRFTSLRSLSLVEVLLPELEFSALLVACPKLESLELTGVEFSDEKVEARAPNLRRLCIVNISLDELYLELESIEHLHLLHCSAEFFTFRCDSTENLETLEINNFNIPESEFYRLLARSPKLKTLIVLDADVDRWTKAVDLDIIAKCCPQLRLMSLRCELKNDDLFRCCLRRSSRFENMVYLKIGWTNMEDSIDLIEAFLECRPGFLDLVEGFLECCPRLKNLVIDESVRELMDEEEQPQLIDYFMASISQIRRKCIDLNVQFEFDEVIP